MKLGQAWTPADDARLLTLLDSKMDRALIAWNLKRTVSAMQTKGHLEQTSSCRAEAEGEGTEVDGKAAWEGSL